MDSGAPRSAAGDFLLWTLCYAPVLYQVKERHHLLFLGNQFRVARPKFENEVRSPKLPLLCSFRVGTHVPRWGGPTPPLFLIPSGSPRRRLAKFGLFRARMTKPELRERFNERFVF